MDENITNAEQAYDDAYDAWRKAGLAYDDANNACSKVFQACADALRSCAAAYETCANAKTSQDRAKTWRVRIEARESVISMDETCDDAIRVSGERLRSCDEARRMYLIARRTLEQERRT